MSVNSLPKTVTRQCRGCDLNRGPSARESSTLTTRLPSHTFTVGLCFFSVGALFVQNNLWFLVSWLGLVALVLGLMLVVAVAPWPLILRMTVIF